MLETTDGGMTGVARHDGLIWGSYLHGIFDADAFRRWFIDRPRQRCGLKTVGKVIAPYDLEPAFDKLADVVRKSIDMKQIYELLRI